MMGNYTEISAGGMEIKVSGNTILFTIGNFQKLMTVAEVEAMLASHQLLIDACKQITNNILISDSDSPVTRTSIEDGIELHNGIRSAIEALGRAE